MNSKVYKPIQYEITDITDLQNITYLGQAVTIFITGTWLVEVNGLTYMPGDQEIRLAPPNVQGTEYSFKPQIKFLKDMKDHPSVKNNPRIRKQGKFILIEILELY
jgi:hypothetical protein